MEKIQAPLKEDADFRKDSLLLECQDEPVAFVLLRWLARDRWNDEIQLSSFMIFREFGLIAS